MTSDAKQIEIDALEQRMKRILTDNENQANIIQEKNDKIDELITKMDNYEQLLKNLGVQMDDVHQQNNELLEKVDDIQQKLDIAVEDRAPQPSPSKKCERFILLRRNDAEFPYYTIRAQDISAKTALRTQRNIYGDITILLDLPYHPNSKTLYVRIKEELKKRGVEFNMCKISLNNSEITEDELIEAMTKIDSEKREI
jgi:DNA repair exonuclease SbcCD ATPase subunit